MRNRYYWSGKACKVIYNGRHRMPGKDGRHMVATTLLYLIGHIATWKLSPDGPGLKNAYQSSKDPGTMTSHLQGLTHLQEKRFIARASIRGMQLELHHAPEEKVNALLCRQGFPVEVPVPVKIPRWQPRSRREHRHEGTFTIWSDNSRREVPATH